MRYLSALKDPDERAPTSLQPGDRGVSSLPHKTSVSCSNLRRQRQRSPPGASAASSAPWVWSRESSVAELDLPAIAVERFGLIENELGRGLEAVRLAAAGRFWFGRLVLVLSE